MDEELTEQQIYDISSLFKIFGNSTRLKILLILMEKERCVKDISIKIGMHQSAVSHQLNLLRMHKLVKCRRKNKKILYSLADNHVYKIILMSQEHINE